MKDDEFEKIMDSWASEEEKSTPELHPTETEYSRVRTRRLRARLPVYARWAMVAVAAASVVLFLIAYPIVLRLGPSDKEELFLAQRKGFDLEKGAVRGPIMHRGGGPKSGTKKGGISFAQLVFHYQRKGSQTIEAVDIRIPQRETLKLTSDDNYGLFLQPASDIYVYIYQLDATGNLAIVFPNSIYRPDKNPLKREQTYYFPPEPNWFYVTEGKGEQRIFVVASVEAIWDLENLYKHNGGSDLMNIIETVRADSSGGIAVWECKFGL